MAASQINPSFTFNNVVWILSILNTGSKAGGHAILVLEGERNGQLVVEQYDIRVGIIDRVTSAGNQIGRITQVNILKPNAYTYPGGYQQFSSQSFHMDARNYAALYKSIESDQKITLQANRMGKGHLSYQLVGSKGILHFLFGETAAGINCAEWCQDKAKVAGIDPGKLAEKKPIPEKATKSMWDTGIYGIYAAGGIALSFFAYKNGGNVVEVVKSFIPSLK